MVLQELLHIQIKALIVIHTVSQPSRDWPKLKSKEIPQLQKLEAFQVPHQPMPRRLLTLAKGYNHLQLIFSSHIPTEETASSHHLSQGKWKLVQLTKEKYSKTESPSPSHIPDLAITAILTELQPNKHMDLRWETPNLWLKVSQNVEVIHLQPPCTSHTNTRTIA